MKKFTKVLKSILTVIAIILLGVIGYLRLPVLSYYLASDARFTIPDIHKGFIPQGIALDPDTNLFYITGYTKDHSASPIYIVDPTRETPDKKILMANSDGSAFTGHAGGLSVLDGKVYVAGGNDACVYAFDLNELNQASSGSSVASCGTVNLKTDDDDIQVSFTTVHDGSLYVGEFYREENYPTNPLHHVKSSFGTNHSLLVKLELDGDEATPVMAYSIRDLIQGACFDNGNLILSASYSVPFSHFYVYDESKADSSQTLTVLGKEIPLVILDGASQTHDLKLAPMSEEIEMYNGQLYTMCESASNKYIFGKLSGAVKVYATDMQKFMN